MSSFSGYMAEYRKQLSRGIIQKAYRGLMDYLLGLKASLHERHPGFQVSGGLYFGYMDMTYFSFHPASIAARKLKVAIVYLHEADRFEAWLAGANKQVQSRYWRLFKDAGWDRFHLVPTTRGADAILEHVLVDHPDFGDLPALSGHIERSVLEFIREVEAFLSARDPV